LISKRIFIPYAAPKARTGDALTLPVSPVERSVHDPEAPVVEVVTVPSLFAITKIPLPNEIV
jgi:hypothetical protein